MKYDLLSWANVIWFDAILDSGTNLTHKQADSQNHDYWIDDGWNEILMFMMCVCNGLVCVVGLGSLTAGEDGETCVNCLEQVKLVELVNRHRLKNHCSKCSKRHRSICSSSSDSKMTQWFKGLIKVDIDEYRKVMANHESVTGPDIQRGAAGAKVKGKFDLLECLTWTVSENDFH